MFIFINDKRIKILFICFILLFSVFNVCQAEWDFNTQSGLNDSGERIGFEVSTKDNPKNPPLMPLMLMEVIFPLFGGIFLITMIYAGYLWMTAQGNQEQVEKAKKIIINSSIGLAIILSAYAITYFFLSAVSKELVVE